MESSQAKLYIFSSFSIVTVHLSFEPPGRAVLVSQSIPEVVD